MCIHFRIRIDGKRQIVPAIFSLKYFIIGFPFIHFLLNKCAAVLAGLGNNETMVLARFFDHKHDKIELVDIMAAKIGGRMPI